MSLVSSDEVDRARLHVHGNGAHGVGLDHPETTALDHGRSTHADRRTLDGDGDVAAAEERGVAGEAPAGGDPDRPYPPRQGSEGMERLGVEAGDDGVVRISGPTSPALGEEHHGEALAPDEVEDPVLLLMVALTLRAGQHHGVVAQYGHRPPGDGGGAAHEPVTGGPGDQVLDAAAPGLRRVGETAVLDEGAGIDEVGHVLPGRAQPPAVALGHGIGPGGVPEQPDPLVQPFQAFGIRSRRRGLGRCPPAPTLGRDEAPRGRSPPPPPRPWRRPRSRRCHGDRRARGIPSSSTR